MASVRRNMYTVIVETGVGAFITSATVCHSAYEYFLVNPDDAQE